MNAETYDRERPRVEVELASMGPRSHERGNADSRAHDVPTYSLQWGRVLMNAETREQLEAGLCCLRFNGAAFS